jgi:hypothetical protein
LIDIAEPIDEVQALWASVVGISPLPNVLADHFFEVFFTLRLFPDHRLLNYSALR